MKDFFPKVSIIIPVYNGANFLAEAIDSALSQTYKNLEVIVINDGSNDDGATEQIALSYGKKIIYYKKDNGGVASALNFGIEKMTGDYFSWLSHDDLYVENKIEKQVKALSQLKNKETIISCNVDIIDIKRNLIKHNHIPEYAKNNVAPFLAFDQTVGLNGCSLLIAKSLFKKYGNFDEKLKVTQDYDLWYRLSKINPFFFLEDSLVKSRQHDNQGSKTMTKEVEYEVDRLHSRFIKGLSKNLLLSYVDNDIKKYYDYFIQYKNMRCLKSAVATAMVYYDLLLEFHEEKLAYEFLNYTIFKNNIDFDFNKNNLIIGPKNKKRILFYNNIWVKGGIERVLSKVFSFLRKDYEIYFVAYNFADNLGYDLPTYIKTIQISNDVGKDLPLTLTILCKVVNADLFIGNQNLDLNFLPTYELLNYENIKSIACNHYNYFLPFEVDWLRSIAYLRNDYYKYANIVTWATEFCTLIYNGINSNGYYLPNPNTFKALNKLPLKKKNHLVTVARYDDAYKRLDLILIAFSNILKKIPDATLTVVGKYDGEMILPSTNDMKLKDFYKTLNIPDKNINFVGEQENLEHFYSEAEAFLFTSSTEGFGMVINEAACFGTPTIAFKISGLEDLITSGVNGYLIPQNNMDELVDCVCNYLNDDIKKTHIMENALKMVEKFNIKNTEKKWNELLKIVLNSNNFEVKIDNKISEIVTEYEKTILNFPYYASMNYNAKVGELHASLFNKVKYYVKTYGVKATLKKVICKIKKIICR